MRLNRLLVVTFCTLVSEWQFIDNVLATCSDCLIRMQQIASGTDVAPFAYRPLTPTLIQWLGGGPTAWALFHLVSLFIFFVLLERWVGQWSKQGTLAVALATIALSLMYPRWYFSEYTLIEWSLLLSALLFLSWWRRSIEKPAGFL